VSRLDGEMRRLAIREDDLSGRADSLALAAEVDRLLRMPGGSTPWSAGSRPHLTQTRRLLSVDSRSHLNRLRSIAIRHSTSRPVGVSGSPARASSANVAPLMQQTSSFAQGARTDGRSALAPTVMSRLQPALAAPRHPAANASAANSSPAMRSSEAFPWHDPETHARLGCVRHNASLMSDLNPDSRHETPERRGDGSS
jgi:hypothetical protein